MSSPFFEPRPYISASLSEINDLLGSIILDGPKFVDLLGEFTDWNIDSMFDKLHQGLDVVRKKLGGDRYGRFRISRNARRHCSSPTRTIRMAIPTWDGSCYSKWKT